MVSSSVSDQFVMQNSRIQIHLFSPVSWLWILIGWILEQLVCVAVWCWACSHRIASVGVNLEGDVLYEACMTQAGWVGPAALVQQAETENRWDKEPAFRLQGFILLFSFPSCQIGCFPALVVFSLRLDLTPDFSSLLLHCCALLFSTSGSFSPSFFFGLNVNVFLSSHSSLSFPLTLILLPFLSSELTFNSILNYFLLFSILSLFLCPLCSCSHSLITAHVMTA